MDDRTTQRHSTHPHRRRPAVDYDRGTNGFRNVVRAFNRTLDEHFPLQHYQDTLGRNRTAGTGRRRRAEGCLSALAKRQSQVRSGKVWIGFRQLGELFGRSRSTAYRAVVDLVAVQLLERESGGGKTHDEFDRLVDAANGYSVPECHQGRPRGGRRPRKPQPQAVDERSPGQILAQEILDRHRASRAGPRP